MRTPPRSSPALDTRVYDIKAKIAEAIVESGGDVTYDNDKVFTVHTGDKSSKRRPYTETTGSSYSHKGKNFEVHFKDRSKKNTYEAKKLVDDLITALKREFATEPKNKRKPGESSAAAATLSSIAGFAATTTKPSTAAGQVITIPIILSRETDSHATRNWTQEQFVINNFMEEPSVGTEDEESNIE